jgi:hypothetical protein
LTKRKHFFIPCTFSKAFIAKEFGTSLQNTNRQNGTNTITNKEQDRSRISLGRIFEAKFLRKILALETR